MHVRGLLTPVDRQAACGGASAGYPPGAAVHGEGRRGPASEVREELEEQALGART